MERWIAQMLVPGQDEPRDASIHLDRIGSGHCF
jgi:hypothetical protein